MVWNIKGPRTIEQLGQVGVDQTVLIGGAVIKIRVGWRHGELRAGLGAGYLVPSEENDC